MRRYIFGAEKHSAASMVVAGTIGPFSLNIENHLTTDARLRESMGTFYERYDSHGYYKKEDRTNYHYGIPR
jgi:hypothetical protein